ncbi:mitochondrial ribosomal protein-like protein subunit S18 [Decorospora gaudefroyi]|uniref:Small ribosomal subunit protein uS11m n=1 Tax=Decorospora gaudefroyi TaxID=184978 RepID=A0A6A5KBA9_9PLEO|nr:mitochondrial ribosomal protein-like protein subunit S18 [Decorospora gaudefroyi]
MASNTALRAFRSVTSTICASCQHTQSLRAFSQAAPTFNASPINRTKAPKSMDALLTNVDHTWHQAGPDYMNVIPDGTGNLAQREWEDDIKHKLHIYATKHNTHLCLTRPNREPIISVSCGNIGFRKAGRGTYDAGYQLAAFLMTRIQDKGLLPQIQKLELIYRGFGPGREAVTKAILGSEGKRIRPLIVKLADSTRLKFGGVRSKKPRRLG